MAVYAIGDIQGCYEEMHALLARISFDPAEDYLWFAGDLVNRGPQSLETLRFISNLGERAVVVLGNHDLHLIAAAHGHALDHEKDTLQPVLTAPDSKQLIDWLRCQPLLHHDEVLGYTLIHAGLPPQWDLATASLCAAEVEQVLRSDDCGEFLAGMYGNKPRRWSPDLQGQDRLRFIVNCFTRLRFCRADGRLHLKEKGPPGSQKPPAMPWFEVPQRASRDLNILFGHWSTLGRSTAPGIFPLDTGCLWGGELTALRIDTSPRYTRVACPGAQTP